MMMNIPVCLSVILSIAPIRDEMLKRTGRRFVRKNQINILMHPMSLFTLLGPKRYNVC